MIEFILKSLHVEYEKEYRFHPVRRFRFDFAIVEHKIAIEYEGLHSKKSGHLTKKGYIKDCDKYNLATVHGWRVLRYTANNQSQCLNDLKIMLGK